MTPSDEQIKLMDDILSFFIDKQSVISDVKFFSYKFYSTPGEVQPAFNSLCAVLNSKNISVAKKEAAENYKILNMDLDKAAEFRAAGGFSAYFKSAYTEPKRHTIIFNANAASQPADSQLFKNPVRFNSTNTTESPKANWFETAVWVGGIIAVMIAIVTLIVCIIQPTKHILIKTT